MVEKMKVVFPKAKEEIIDFLNYYMLGNSKIILYPRCSVVFDEKYEKEIKVVRSFDPWRGNMGGSTSRFFFDKREVLDRNQNFPRNSGNSKKSYVPPINTPKGEWVIPMNQKSPNQQKGKVVDMGIRSSYNDNSHVSKKYSHVSHN